MKIESQVEQQGPVENSQGCLPKFALGSSQGYSDCPEGHRNFFQKILRNFHVVKDFWIKIVKIMRPRGALGLALNLFRF